MSLSDAYVRVDCDECGESDEIELTALAQRGSYDMRNVDKELDRMGWLSEDGCHYCENCAEERCQDE